MLAYSLSVCCIVSMSLVTCQNGLLFLFFCPLFSVGSLSFTLAHNGRGYATGGKTWTLNYPPLRNLPAKTELANWAETRLVYEPLLPPVIFYFCLFNPIIKRIIPVIVRILPIILAKLFDLKSSKFKELIFIINNTILARIMTNAEILII